MDFWVKFKTPLGIMIARSSFSKLEALYFSQNTESESLISNYNKKTAKLIFIKTKEWLDIYL